MNKGMRSPYRNLALMLVLHFIVMFAVMYTMVYSWGDVIPNLNQFYMTMMMVAPTALTMLLLMPSMYPNKKRNRIIYASSIVVFGAFLLFMRDQSLVGDRQFLKSMIPHHSGAILMCERANLKNPEIQKLCRQIIESQRKEIAQMQELLNR